MICLFTCTYFDEQGCNYIAIEVTIFLLSFNSFWGLIILHFFTRHLKVLSIFSSENFKLLFFIFSLWSCIDAIRSIERNLISFFLPYVYNTMYWKDHHYAPHSPTCTPLMYIRVHRYSLFLTSLNFPSFQIHLSLCPVLPVLDRRALKIGEMRRMHSPPQLHHWGFWLLLLSHTNFKIRLTVFKLLNILAELH